MEASLIQFDAAQRQLAVATDLKVVKEIHDRFHALRPYLTTIRANHEMQNRCAEIKIRAQRRAGELLLLIPRMQGARTDLTSSQTVIMSSMREAGIGLGQKYRWEMIARIPVERFEQHIAETKATGGELTSAGLFRLARILQHEARIAAIEAQPILTPEGLFDVIVVDPPWPYEGTYDPDHWTGLVASPYPEMSLEEIEDMELPAAEDCMLWLWTTNAFLHEAHHILEEWDFERKSIVTWVKNGLGLGYWLRNRTEHCLLGVRGNPFHKLTNETTAIHARRREHSRKPDEFYDMVDRLCRGRKLDYFSRQPRPGWAQCGNEPAKFAQSLAR